MSFTEKVNNGTTLVLCDGEVFCHIGKIGGYWVARPLTIPHVVTRLNKLAALVAAYGLYQKHKPKVEVFMIGSVITSYIIKGEVFSKKIPEDDLALWRLRYWFGMEAIIHHMDANGEEKYADLVRIKKVVYSGSYQELVTEMITPDLYNVTSPPVTEDEPFSIESDHYNLFLKGVRVGDVVLVNEEYRKVKRIDSVSFNSSNSIAISGMCTRDFTMECPYCQPPVAKELPKGLVCPRCGGKHNVTPEEFKEIVSWKESEDVSGKGVDG